MGTPHCDDDLQLHEGGRREAADQAALSRDAQGGGEHLLQQRGTGPQLAGRIPRDAAGRQQRRGDRHPAAAGPLQAGDAPLDRLHRGRPDDQARTAHQSGRRVADHQLLEGDGQSQRPQPRTAVRPGVLRGLLGHRQRRPPLRAGDDVRHERHRQHHLRCHPRGQRGRCRGLPFRHLRRPLDDPRQLRRLLRDAERPGQHLARRVRDAELRFLQPGHRLLQLDRLPADDARLGQPVPQRDALRHRPHAAVRRRIAL